MRSLRHYAALNPVAMLPILAIQRDHDAEDCLERALAFAVTPREWTPHTFWMIFCKIFQRCVTRPDHELRQTNGLIKVPGPAACLVLAPLLRRWVMLEEEGLTLEGLPAAFNASMATVLKALVAATLAPRPAPAPVAAPIAVAAGAAAAAAAVTTPAATPAVDAAGWTTVVSAKKVKKEAKKEAKLATQRVCSYFNSRNGCKFGARCHDAHLPAAPRVVASRQVVPVALNPRALALNSALVRATATVVGRPLDTPTVEEMLTWFATHRRSATDYPLADWGLAPRVAPQDQADDDRSVGVRAGGGVQIVRLGGAFALGNANKKPDAA